MPADIRAALRAGKVEAAYEARPRYQHNDYVGWILGPKLPATRDQHNPALSARPSRHA